MQINTAIARTSRALPLVLFALLLCPVARSQPANSSTNAESELYKKLKAIPGVVEVRETRGSPSAKESYEVTFEQPLDHQNPNGEKFQQHFFLAHSDYNKPVLLGTEGY